MNRKYNKVSITEVVEMAKQRLTARGYLTKEIHRRSRSQKKK